MNMIKSFSSKTLWMLAAGMMFFSCSDEDVIDAPKVEEGLPVSLKFTLTTPKPNQVSVSRATDEEETRVAKLALFFYQGAGKPAFTYEVPGNQLVKVDGGSSTNYFYNVEIPETAGLTSGTYQLYAVANWNVGFWDSSITFAQLAAMTKSEMDAYCVKKTAEGTDISETAILLSGKYGRTDGTLTLQRTPASTTAPESGVNVLTESIHMRRSISKNIFYFENGANVKFTPETYEIHNYSQTATLMERDGWQTNQGVSDNVSGTHPGKLAYMGSTSTAKPNFINFMDRTVEMIDVTNSGTTTTTVKKPGFMFYMPENVQQPLSSPASNIQREAKDQNSFKHAPKDATYVVVHGKYHGPKGGTGSDANVMVDADVHYTILLGDFSQKSGKADNFTVRRNCKYTYKVTVKGVNNIIVEAVLKTEKQPGAEGDVVHTGTDNVKRLDAHYETCILKFNENVIKGKNDFGIVLRSPLGNQLIESVNNFNGWNTLDANWIHFIQPASATAYRAYPGTGSNQLLTLQQLLDSFKNGTYMNYCVRDAYGNLCIQAFVDEYYYADQPLAKFINTPDRSITVATGTNVSPDGNSTYVDTPIFSIQQRSIKSMFSLNTANPFGLESTDRGQEDVPLTGEAVQRGPESGNDSDMNSGFNNSVSNITIGARWSQYIDVASGTLINNVGLKQFLLRNRDENGNDIIDREEIKWYMPSVNQCNAIWAGYFALTEEARWTKKLYFTSTNNTFRTYWAQEGAFGQYKEEAGNDNGYSYVRCIRALGVGSYDAATTHVSNYLNNRFNVSALGNNALRTTPQTTEYHFHWQHDRINRLPQAFQMAKRTLSLQGNETGVNVSIQNTTAVRGQSSSSWGTTNTPITYTVSLSIVREKDALTGQPLTYCWNATNSWNPSNLITGTTYKGTVKGNERKSFQGKISYSTTQELWIVASNGNAVLVNVQDATSCKTNPRILSSNLGKTTFTRAEIASAEEWCKNYSEEPNGSDRGQWRIPNQREMLVMFMHSTNGKGTGGYTLPAFLCARTYYDKRSSKANGIYFVQNNGSFITTSEERPDLSFVIVPVRDVTASSVVNQQSDASLEPGGSIIR